MNTNPDTPLSTGDPEEIKKVQPAFRLSARLIYEVVRTDGEEELRRPLVSLIWSGLAAGFLISFSVIGMGLFRTHLPEQPWRPLVESFGYSFGFLLVILGRMQLFTENTITTVLPLYVERDRFLLIFQRVARLWLVVLTANIIGAAIAAAFITWSGAFGADLLASIREISLHATGFTAGEVFVRAIPAGILLAGIVWMMPSAGGNAFWIVLLFTYLISLGEFAHVIAGSVEVAVVVFSGESGVFHQLANFVLPALAGNVFGGTAVFSLTAWGQVQQEV